MRTEIEVDGLRFSVRIGTDFNADPPWENEDGHGPVSGRTRREKRPGERVLCSDRRTSRYYDFAEAVRIAKRDGWGIDPKRQDALEQRIGRPLTRGMIAYEAAVDDFTRLRDWCDNRWRYVGLIVELLDVEGNKTGDGASLWGIESDSGDEYFDTEARALAEQLAESIGDARTIERGRPAHRCTITVRW